MSCDLKRYYLELARQISALSDDRDKGPTHIILDSSNLPITPTVIETDRIYIRKTYHAYGSYRVDLLWMHAHKETYQYLGLLILAVLFQPTYKVQLKLTHHLSDIKNFVFENNCRAVDALSSGLNSRPFAFCYYPGLVRKHPFVNMRDIYNLPSFSLTNLRDCMITEQDWQQRDTVICNGNDEGNAQFAELLINAGRAESDVKEIELQGECGNGGVTNGSAEISLFFPGHIPAWSDADWQ